MEREFGCHLTIGPALEFGNPAGSDRGSHEILHSVHVDLQRCYFNTDVDMFFLEPVKRSHSQGFSSPSGRVSTMMASLVTGADRRVR